MRRPLFPRLCSAILTLWLSVVSLAPASFHSCPVHAAMHGGHDHGAMVMGGEHGNAAAGGQTSSPDQQAQCTCPGACCASASAEVPRQPIVPGAAVVAESRPVAAPRAERSRAAAPHVLPFANGPPTV